MTQELSSLLDAELAHWKPNTSIELLNDSVGGHLQHHASTIGDRPAVHYLASESSDEIITLNYKQLLEKSEACARWLVNNTEPGDRVAIWSRNELEAVFLQYGCALAGRIVTYFNTAWTDVELEHGLSLVTPSIVFAGVDHAGRSLQERLSTIATCNIKPLSEINNIIVSNTQAQLPEVTANDPCLIQFTSGTTGKAKGASLSHRAVLLGGWLRPYAEGATEQDIWLNAVPFHHIGGSIAVMVGAMGVGGSFVVLTKHDRDQLIRLMPIVKATRMGGVPTMWLDILESADISPTVKLNSVSLGGASVPPELAKGIFERLGARCGIGYGQSEFTIISAVMPDDPVEVVCETVGRPLPHIEMKIIDPETGKILKHNEAGEICVRGPTCMDGYWGNPEATASTIDDDGFLHTGDTGILDEQGYCTIKGRLRDVIIRGGENIYPIEVENALQTHPAVAMAAVVATPHPRLGQDVGAAIKLKPGAETNEEDLEAHVKTQIASYKTPRSWRFIDEMPITASGKIRKIDLEPLFLD